MRTRSWIGRPAGRAVVAAAVVAVVTGAPAGASVDAPPVWGATTSRVSVTADGAQSSGPAACCSAISRHGRYVVFPSDASDLVAGDTNGSSDIFVRDRLTGTTTRVSVGSGEQQADAGSSTPVVSYDGRLVAFVSDATNLVPGDTNGEPDVFVRDVVRGQTTRVSVAADGGQLDGRSFDPELSGDGRFVTFVSDATDAVPGDTNGGADVFLRALSGGMTERVSVASGGQQGDGLSYQPVISRGGRYVAFASAATNLVADDTNGETDVFLHDRISGDTERVSVGPRGRQGTGSNPMDTASPASVSARGRYVTFNSEQSNLVRDDANGAFDAFLRDRERERTRLLSVDSEGRPIGSASFVESAARQARYVLLGTDNPFVVPGDTNGAPDLFLRDRRTGDVRVVSVAQDGSQGAEASFDGALSADGRHVTFRSFATNLVPGDTNGEVDIFVRDRAVDRPTHDEPDGGNAAAATD